MRPAARNGTAVIASMAIVTGTPSAADGHPAPRRAPTATAAMQSTTTTITAVQPCPGRLTATSPTIISAPNPTGAAPNWSRPDR